MTTACLSKSSSPAPMVALFLLAMATVALAAVALGTHAVERHGDTALAARECFERPEYVFVRGDREAFVCLTSLGKWGIAIQEGGREVTAFIKDKFRSLEQVFRYLQNRGYTPR